MKSNSDKILLILDLDETLIHSSEIQLGRPADFMAYDYHVYKRPYLDDFLESCFEWFNVAVWSSAGDDYVAYVVERIFKCSDELKFVWGRRRATLRRHLNYRDDAIYYDPSHLHYIKPLYKVRRLGWPLERMLIVDDTPEKCVRNYGNAIYPSPFEGEVTDDTLFWLEKYLKTLRHKTNVRGIEKRNWLEKIKSKVETSGQMNS